MDLIEGIDFDGFSMPERNMNPSEIALFMIKFYQMGIKAVHILGTTRIVVMALSAYIARHMFDWVSLDSTTWLAAAEYQNYLNPHDLKCHEISSNIIIDENIENDCDCPWCKGKTFSYIKNLPYEERMPFLKHHNFWVTEKVGRELFKKAVDRASFLSYLKKELRDKAELNEFKRILYLIDGYRDLDISKLQKLLVRYASNI